MTSPNFDAIAQRVAGSDGRWQDIARALRLYVEEHATIREAWEAAGGAITRDPLRNLLDREGLLRRPGTDAHQAQIHRARYEALERQAGWPVNWGGAHDDPAMWAKRCRDATAELAARIVALTAKRVAA